MNKIPVGVLGASGYAGRELCALIASHPALSLAFAAANDQRGATIRAAGQTITFVSTDDVSLASAELVFSALPHAASKDWVARLRSNGVRAVDLSSDLRPGNGCEGIAYGLTELARSLIRGAELVSNPGCYPTSILLGLGPLAELGLIADRAIVANSASGTTGAGIAPKRELLFGEVTENYRAYGVGNEHRHLAEMRATLAGWNAPGDLVFTPHLLPVARGILSTVTLTLTQPLDNPLELWRKRYAGELFIELSPEAPSIRDVAHRNVARISVAPIAGTKEPMLVVSVAIDNLLKGAAGQAVQNATLRLNLQESAGLPA
ncbi:MAG: N-acetyl-gamma-glutamyl-phosphate reductase [Gemmatimonadales bacterium]